ncbi:BPI fold-containing family B member 1 [Sphaerodactylus townsendi]|uniref:BPI fold-containing family B member 1 n=1 Tax=Sphaerodactylus townsendi TaxID=933632 RepID=UPI002025CD3A|nr:BPI fold-containing family B member 1 [Sphaerodactylus townsendi]
MLPFLSLFILGSLLTQNAQGNSQPLAIARLSPELLQHYTLRVISRQMDPRALKDRLQSLPLEETVKEGLRQGNGGGLLTGLPLVGGLVNNVLGNILKIKINKITLLDLQIKLHKHETKIIVTIPADIELEVRCPLSLLGSILRLKLYLDIQVGVRVVKDPLTGHIKLTIENCHNNPGHLRITLLNDYKKNPLVHFLNRTLRLVTDVLEKTVPNLLQKQLCPLLNGLVQNVLDLLQGSLSSQVHGEMFQLAPESFRLHDGSLNLVYEGQIQMPGGQIVTLPPDSVPISAKPLEGSPMNMILSGKYVALALRALLPPRVFNLGRQNEVAAFRSQIAAVIPKASNIRVLQIASGLPSLSLAVGKVEVWQPVEIRAFAEHPTEADRPLLTIRVTLALLAHPSIADGKMMFTLHRPRIASLVPVSSSIGNFDGQLLTGVMTRLLSASLLPHQNKILAEGIPIPLVQQLGLNSLRVSAGKDGLLVFVPPNGVPVSA